MDEFGDAGGVTRGFWNEDVLVGDALISGIGRE